MTTSTLAGVIVTFHPTREMLERVAGYASFLGHVVVIDNTPPSASSLPMNVPGVTFLAMGGNSGLGHALNVGVSHLAALGFSSVILLDQDSVLTSDATAKAIAAIADDVGIVALHQAIRRATPDQTVQGPKTPQHGWIDVPVTITSGSILNVRAYHECGPFDAELFIDYVDYDYCLRLRQKGYRIVQCLHALLDHELGQPKTVRFFGRPISFITHRPFRLYYITRNGLYVATRYFFFDPKTALGVVMVLLKEFVKAFALEKDKAQRLRYIVLGAWHWISRRYGRVVTP